MNLFADIVHLHRLGEESMDEIVEQAHLHDHLVTFWDKEIYDQELAVAIGVIPEEVDNCEFEKLLLPVYLEGGVSIMEDHLDLLDFELLSGLVLSLQECETPIIITHDGQAIGVVGVSGCPWMLHELRTKFDPETKTEAPTVTPRTQEL